jgi:hypothetical protein
LKGNTALKELDVSSNGWSAPSYQAQPDGQGFAQGISKGIVDNGAISSINLLRNFIPIEQAHELVKIMQAKEKLITLCGLSKEETELDFSGQRLCAGDAVLIANNISDMGAISSVNLLKNGIGIAQAEDLVSILKDHPTLKSLCGNTGNETGHERQDEQCSGCYHACRGDHRQ